MEGVVRAPSAFSITFGFLPSITATQEFVVPRSMPITFAIVFSPGYANQSNPISGIPDGVSPSPLIPSRLLYKAEA